MYFMEMVNLLPNIMYTGIDLRGVSVRISGKEPRLLENTLVEEGPRRM